MINYKKKYQKIVDELVRKSFPELGGKKIEIFEFNSKRYYGSSNKIFFWRIIGISKKARKFPKRIIKGILAHELSHLIYYGILGSWASLVFDFKYWTDSQARTKEEIRAIKNTIERGYAKESYAVAVQQERNPYRKRINKVYLSPEQIKSYAKKIGKW